MRCAKIAIGPSVMALLTKKQNIKIVFANEENYLRTSVAEALLKAAQYFEKLITDVYDLNHINDAIDAFKTRKNLCKIMIKV